LSALFLNLFDTEKTKEYRINQDRLFQSDFDKFLGKLPFIEE